MKTAGIITFHGAHNFGSVLQAFALQQTVRGLGLDAQIINFRTPVQKNMYARVSERKINSPKALLRRILFSPHRRALDEKYDKFEDFIAHTLSCTEREYASLGELTAQPPQFDYYICGSDQIWNRNCTDFDEAYFLPFVNNGKKIAYAPSFGPHAQIPADIADRIGHFAALSTREEVASERLAQVTGRRVETLPDPTLLLSAQQWQQYVGKPLIEGPYIYLYSPYFRPGLFEAAEVNPKRLPVVISNFMGLPSLFKKGLVRQFNTGPWDFLNLIYHADKVVSGSFHAAVFSVIFGKELCSPFAQTDDRIANLLQHRDALEKERLKGINFLKEQLC